MTYRLAVLASTLSLACLPAASLAASPTPPRQLIELRNGGPLIALQRQPSAQATARAEVVYVHGSSFGADLSIYFAFDGRSWADELADAGFAVWGFDFVGYGRSARYPADAKRPPGDIDDAMRDLRRVVRAVRQRNGDRPVVLLAHSRGGVVAARYASEQPGDVRALVLFAPVVTRPATGTPAAPAAIEPSHFPLSAWAQYRRFVQDVPRGEPQVLDEAHMESWAAAFLASDPTSASRQPTSVMTPAGPLADVQRLWSGEALYDAARITAPTLLVRGEWDSSCNDADARHLLAGLTGARTVADVKLPHATHLMHLEHQRVALHAQVNRFLLKVLP